MSFGAPSKPGVAIEDENTQHSIEFNLPDPYLTHSRPSSMSSRRASIMGRGRFEIPHVGRTFEQNLSKTGEYFSMDSVLEDSNNHPEYSTTLLPAPTNESRSGDPSALTGSGQLNYPCYLQQMVEPKQAKMMIHSAQSDLGDGAPIPPAQETRCRPVSMPLAASTLHGSGLSESNRHLPTPPPAAYQMTIGRSAHSYQLSDVSSSTACSFISDSSTAVGSPTRIMSCYNPTQTPLPLAHGQPDLSFLSSSSKNSRPGLPNRLTKKEAQEDARARKHRIEQHKKKVDAQAAEEKKLVDAGILQAIPEELILVYSIRANTFRQTTLTKLLPNAAKAQQEKDAFAEFYAPGGPMHGYGGDNITGLGYHNGNHGVIEFTEGSIPPLLVDGRCMIVPIAKKALHVKFLWRMQMRDGAFKVKERKVPLPKLVTYARNFPHGIWGYKKVEGNFEDLYIERG